MRKFRLLYPWQAIERPRSQALHRHGPTQRGAEVERCDGDGDGDRDRLRHTERAWDATFHRHNFRKICECAAFVADMTSVAVTEGGKLVPNPNGTAIRCRRGERGASFW